MVKKLFVLNKNRQFPFCLKRFESGKQKSESFLTFVPEKKMPIH